MTGDTRKRTISYYRVDWPSSKDHTLQEILESSLHVLPTENATTRLFLDGKARIKDRKATDHGLFLHLVAWTDRQGASTVPHSGEPLSSVEAGEDWDYLTRNGMMMIYKDHCLMTSGLNILPASMKKYLVDIVDYARFEKGSGTREDDSKFQLLPVESRRMVEKIYNNGGVKMIEFDIDQYALTASGLESDNKLHRMIEATTDMFRGNSLPESPKEEGDLNLKLVAKIGKGRRSKLNYQRFTSVAREVRDAGFDDYMIFETKDGMRVRYGDIILRESFEIEMIGNTIDHEDAWSKMYDYFLRLREDEFLS